MSYGYLGFLWKYPEYPADRVPPEQAAIVCHDHAAGIQQGLAAVHREKEGLAEGSGAEVDAQNRRIEFKIQANSGATAPQGE